MDIKKLLILFIFWFYKKCCIKKFNPKNKPFNNKFNEL